MAVDIRQGNLANDSDANFRSWGKAVSDALQAVGLTKLSAAEAAGQINWATVTRPLTADTMQGYEWYRFSDALQATAPVFIQIRYGSSGVAADRPGLNIVVYDRAPVAGTGAAQASSLATYNNYIGANMAQNALWNIYTSGGSNRISCMIGPDSNSNNLTFGFSIERTKNSDGSDNTDGVIEQTYGAQGLNRAITTAAYRNGLGFSQVLYFGGVQADTAPPNFWEGMPVYPAGYFQGNGRTGIFGANTAIYPWLIPSARGYENPGMGFLGYWNADVGAGATPAITHYGVAHTYRTFHGLNFVSGGYYDDGASTIQTLQASGQLALAMRWE